MSMLGSELESLLHVLGITQSELAETYGSQMLLHEPVRLESVTSGYLAGWSTTSTSTRCAGPAINASWEFKEWRASERLPSVKCQRSKAQSA